MLQHQIWAAVAAIVFTVLADFFASRGSHAIRDAIVAAIVAFFGEWLLLFFGMPDFAHFTSAGFFWTGVIVAVATVIGVIPWSEYSEDWNSAFVAAIVSFVALVIYGVVAFFVPPLGIEAWDNPTYDQLAGLLNLREATPEDYELAVADDDLLKIHPAAALLEARGVMPEDVGSYAAVNSTYEQIVGGEQVYVTDLKVVNRTAFREVGEVLPGFMIRPAREVIPSTTFVSGYAIKYAPEAWWDNDLDRYVYLSYTINCQCQIDHLDVLELDDEGQPKYTATAWEFVVGNKGMQPKEVLVVDPVTGQIDIYGMDEVPEWIDRVYSMERVLQMVEWWATYANWDARLNILQQSTLGKLRIDSYEDVYGHEGRLSFQFTITSVGSDQTLIHEINVNPRTGEAILFEAEGKTRAAIDNMIDERTFDLINPNSGAEPVECELQSLLGVQTWYCILQARESAEQAAYEDASYGGAVVGYAFLQAKFSSTPSMVIAARTFDEAWNAFRLQLTEGGGSNADIQGVGVQTITFEGEVLYKGDRPVDGSIWLLVGNEKYPRGIYFKVSENNPIITLTQPGHEVFIVAFDLVVDDVNDVIELTNNSLPALRQEVQPTEIPVETPVPAEGDS